MKKILLGIVLSVSLVLGLVKISNIKDVDVVKENGFMVLKDRSKDESTIVAKVTDTDKDKDGYIIATNVFDKSDTVAIDNMGYEQGEVVLITFNNDDVVNVEHNELTIGDKVDGQKIK